MIGTSSNFCSPSSYYPSTMWSDNTVNYGSYTYPSGGSSMKSMLEEWEEAREKIRNGKDGCLFIDDVRIDTLKTRLQEVFNKMSRDLNITNVKMIKENKVVQCTINGQKYKAVCDESDQFSLEGAITICLCKYFLGGSSSYNNTIRKIVKHYNNAIKEAEEKAIKEAEEAERIKNKRKKNAARRKANQTKNFIMQKDAYKQAIKELIAEGNFHEINLPNEIQIDSSAFEGLDKK